jgi:hypothetical protein
MIAVAASEAVLAKAPVRKATLTKRELSAGLAVVDKGAELRTVPLFEGSPVKLSKYYTDLFGPFGSCGNGGSLYRTVDMNRETGTVVPSWEISGSTDVCLVQPASAPPPPPTSSEIADAIPLPIFAINTSPIEKGLTGLETWFWCNSPGRQSLSVSVRGYTVAVTAEAAKFVWLPGDNAAHTSMDCGSKPDPDGDGHEAAARHMYETKDRFEVELQVTWTGSYRFRGHGRRGEGDLGGVTVSSTRVYPVHEARAVLTQ